MKNQTPQNVEKELREVAAKHWHTGHGRYGDPCFSFDRQELDMFLKDVQKYITQSNKAYLLSVLPDQRFSIKISQHGHKATDEEYGFNVAIDTIKKNAGIE